VEQVGLADQVVPEAQEVWAESVNQVELAVLELLHYQQVEQEAQIDHLHNHLQETEMDPQQIVRLHNRLPATGVAVAIAVVAEEVVDTAAAAEEAAAVVVEDDNQLPQWHIRNTHIPDRNISPISFFKKGHIISGIDNDIGGIHKFEIANFHYLVTIT